METTLADGLAIPQVGANGFEIASSRVDKTVTVTEEQIALASYASSNSKKVLLKEQGQRHSPPVFPGSFRNSPESGSSFVLSGGNIDPNILSRVIQSGLVADGRRSRVGVF
jgi:threonine dehydratase